MATTFLSYGEHDVQVPEPPVIAVGYMLFHEGRLNAKAPKDRLHFEQMTREFETRTIGAGCTRLGLDELLQGDSKKEAEFLALVQQARASLASYGKEVPTEYVNQVMAVHEPDWKDVPWPTPWLHKVLDLIEALIQGGRLPPSDWLANIRKGTFPGSRSRRRQQRKS